ncbi:hypothetical protein ECOLI_200059 [Escherichia coli]|nr:hypothetical protein ECOLI_200059 [Escherichia coli]
MSTKYNNVAGQEIKAEILLYGLIHLMLFLEDGTYINANIMMRI